MAKNTKPKKQASSNEDCDNTCVLSLAKQYPAYLFALLQKHQRGYYNFVYFFLNRFAYIIEREHPMCYDFPLRLPYTFRSTIFPKSDFFPSVIFHLKKLKKSEYRRRNEHISFLTRSKIFSFD